MYNKSFFLVDIAEYNAYIIEIEAPSINIANESIFSLSKQMSKNIKYRFIESTKKAALPHSEIFKNINLNQVKRKTNDGWKSFNFENKEPSLEESFLFCYNVLVIEYNRYRIKIENVDTENVLNLIRMNKSQISENYYPSLIQINSRPYFKGNQNILFID